ncbi:MAG: hypothetical protein NT169_12715 [Chloroflexi bacterium]|nr:hypothetical protein [Chloroflexota bacterium]
MITHPYQHIPSRRRLALFLPLLVLTLALTAILQAVDAPLKTTAVPQGIVSFELVGTTAAASRILASWAAAREHAAFSLGLDFLYMPSYALTIGLACAWLAEALRRRARWLGALGVILAWGQIVAALLDATENVALTTMLFDAVADPWPVVAFGCATVKFLLIGAGLLYALAGGLIWVIARPRGRVEV